MGHAKFLSLLLVRAGPNEWDRRSRISGRAEVPLVPGVVDDIARDAKAFKSKVALILCGPDAACMQVGQAVSSSTGAKCKPVSDLHEVSLGLWEGMLEEDVEQRYRSCFRQWKMNPAKVSIPSGEPLVAAQQRLTDVIDNLPARLSLEAQHVAIVVRPLAWGLLRCWADDRPLADLWEMMEPESSMTPVLVPSSRLRESTLLSGALSRLRA